LHFSKAQKWGQLGLKKPEIDQMLFIALTPEQDQELALEIKAAKEASWLKRLTTIRLSSKKSQSLR